MPLTRVLFRNAGTKLLALAIACATWYVLAGERRERISERTYRIPLSIVNVPAGLMIVSPLPDAVDVRVRGSFTRLRQLEPSKIEAVVDLLGATPGERRYPLAPEDINVPAEVQVIAIAPAEIRLTLDTLAERVLPVVPDVSGEPAEGASVQEVAADPPVARVVGPSKALARLTNLRTESVSLEGRTASFTVTTTVVAPAAGIRIKGHQAVVVHVGIRPAPTPVPTPAPTPRRRRR
jgi:YbbR domain-containing protein